MWPPSAWLRRGGSRRRIIALLVASAAATVGCSATVTGQGTALPTPSSSTATASNPPTVTVTASPPTASDTSSSAAPAVVPAGFVGTWSGHGRSLTVQATGPVSISFRLYIPCTPTRTTECDPTNGNEISDGGQVLGSVVEVINSTTVIVLARSTTAPDIVPLGRFRLGLDLSHDAVAPFVGQLSGAPFCGPQAPVGYCGA